MAHTGVVCRFHREHVQPLCFSRAPRRRSVQVSRLYGVFVALSHSAMLLSCSQRTSHSEYHAISPVKCSQARKTRDDGETETGEVPRCEATGVDGQNCFLSYHVCAATHRRCPDLSRACSVVIDYDGDVHRQRLQPGCWEAATVCANLGVPDIPSERAAIFMLDDLEGSDVTERRSLGPSVGPSLTYR